MDRAHGLAIELALLAFVWWLLTAGSMSSWIVGGPAVAAALLARRAVHHAPGANPRLSGTAPFVAAFLTDSVRSGFDVALRALHPRPRLRPTLMRFESRLPPGAARVLFTHAVSLLPGTLCARGGGESLVIHALDGDTPVRADLHRLERRVAALFALQLSERGSTPARGERR